MLDDFEEKFDSLVDCKHINIDYDLAKYANDILCVKRKMMILYNGLKYIENQIDENYLVRIITGFYQMYISYLQDFDLEIEHHDIISNSGRSPQIIRALRKKYILPTDFNPEYPKYLYQVVADANRFRTIINYDKSKDIFKITQLRASFF